MQTPLFDGIVRQPIKIGDFDAWSPMFVPRVSVMGAVFTARAEALRDLLPSAGYRPLEAMPGVGLAGIFGLEYLESDVGPYNEFALGILCAYGRTPRFPRGTLARAVLSRRVTAFIADLPVSTELSVRGGVEHFNFPKYLADISIRETASHRIITVRDPQSADLIAELEGWRLRTGGGLTRLVPGSLRDLTLQALPRIGGETRLARMRFRLSEAAFMPGAGASLRLGDHPRAAPYRRLGLGRPVFYLYAPACQAVLFEPEAWRP